MLISWKSSNFKHDYSFWVVQEMTTFEILKVSFNWWKLHTDVATTTIKWVFLTIKLMKIKLKWIIIFLLTT